MNRIQLPLILLTLFVQSLSFAVTTIKLDPETMSQNDTFRLILSSDEVNKGLPNLTPLQKDFSILGTEHNVSYNIINGQSSSLSQWIILLRPKKTGTLTIPSLHIGTEQTKPGSIEVLEGDVPTTSSNDAHTTSVSDAVMLKTQISETNPYVNQQVLYTIKLYNNQRLIDAQYHPPSVENALLIPLGEERHYQTQENNQDYMVEEQQYAIFPQKSGPFTITPPSFDAAVFDSGYPKRLHLQDKPTQINIRPTPGDYPYKNWLPAKNITLTETYDASTSAIKAGDTITRTVILQALAMPAQLLPTLEFTANSQFKTYPESPEIKNTVKPNELMGSSTIKVTYLFNEAGEITIPKLDIPWFNISTGKTEIASLPPHTLTVQPSGASTKQSAAPRAPVSSKSAPNDEPTRQPLPSTSSSYSFLLALGIGFLSGSILVLLFLWLRKTNFSTTSKEKRTAIKRILNACEKNNANQVHDALLQWAQIQWPEKKILNLQDIAIQCRDSNLKKELTKLSQSLYSSHTAQTWQGANLRESFKHFSRSNTKNTQEEHISRQDLPPMNP